MFAFFGSNNRHGTPHHETIKWFQSEAYCRIHVYEKPTGITGWLLGLAAFRELLGARLLRGPAGGYPEERGGRLENRAAQNRPRPERAPAQECEYLFLTHPGQAPWRQENGKEE